MLSRVGRRRTSVDAIDVAVADEVLFDIIIVDLSFKRGFDAGFEAELGIVKCK